MKVFKSARRSLVISASAVVVGGLAIGVGLAGAAPTVNEVATVPSSGYIAVGANGNVDIPNYDVGPVYQVTPSGDVSTVATFAPGESGGPWAATGDAAGNVYVDLYYAGVIEKITPEGSVSVYASGADLYYVYGMAFGPSGLLYVESDTNIYSVSSSGTITFVASGAGGTGLAIDQAGNFYSSDDGTDVYKTTPGGVSTVLATIPGAGIWSVAVGPSGAVYAADYSGGNIYRIAPSGAVTTAVTFAELGGDSKPFSLAVDSSGDLYAAADSGPIWKITGYDEPPTPQGLAVTETSGQVTATWSSESAQSYTCTLMYGYNEPSSFQVTTSSTSCAFYGLDTTLVYGVQVVANNGSASSAAVVAFGTAVPVVTPPPSPAPSAHKRTILCQRNHGTALRKVTAVHPTCPRGWHRVA